MKNKLIALSLLTAASSITNAAPETADTDNFKKASIELIQKVGIPNITANKLATNVCEKVYKTTMINAELDTGDNSNTYAGYYQMSPEKQDKVDKYASSCSEKLGKNLLEEGLANNYPPEVIDYVVFMAYLARNIAANGPSYPIPQKVTNSIQVKANHSSPGFGDTPTKISYTHTPNTKKPSES